MTTHRFIQVGNIWINPDSITSIVDDPERDICTVYSRDLTKTVPVVLRESNRASFLHFLENNSYVISTLEESDELPIKMAIPAIVLFDICRAISADPVATAQAYEQMILLDTYLLTALSELTAYVQNEEVRSFALNELRGVKYDSDNK